MIFHLNNLSNFMLQFCSVDSGGDFDDSYDEEDDDDEEEEEEEKEEEDG